MNRRLHQHSLKRVVHLLRNKVDLRLLNRLAVAGHDLHRQTHADVRGAFGWNVDVGFQFGIFIHGRQQRLRRNVVAHVDRNIADDARKWSGQVVISKLTLLGNAGSLGRIPIRLRILERLHRIIVILFAGDAALVQPALPCHLLLVVLKDGLLLLLGAALLFNRRLLL